MNIRLIRNFTRPIATDGILVIDGLRTADTAEFTPTMLRPGTYKVKIEHCAQYRRKMPIITIANQTNCIHCKRRQLQSRHAPLPSYCPMIKIGNGVYNRADGSIIIGDHHLNGVILNSATYYDRLIDRLDKAANRGEEIYLTIIDQCVRKYS